ncbi:MAG: hypothetical protein QXM09_06785 [Candidatus Methanomethylicaceae archaeon]
MRVIGIAWAESSPRLNDIINEIGGQSILISWMRGMKILAPIRYALLAIKTLLLSIRYKPDIIIAQNPPIFCPLSVYVYTKLFKKKFVIDHHSLSIVKKGLLWKIISLIELWLMKRSLINIVIHEGYEKLCKKIGVNSITIFDAIPEIPHERKKLSKFTIISPLGGHPDEDISTLTELAKILKNENIRLIITGRIKKNSNRIIGYVGYLPKDKYVQLLSMSHIGICLIKDNNWTLPYVIFEFIGAQIPFLITKTPVTMLFGDFFLISKKEDILKKLLLFKDQNIYIKSLKLLENLKNILQNKRKVAINNFKTYILQ